MNTPPLPRWFNADVSKASRLLLEQALDIFDPHIESLCRANYRKLTSPVHPVELKFANVDVHQLMQISYSDILERSLLPDIGVTVPDIEENLQLWLECRKKQWQLSRARRKKVKMEMQQNSGVVTAIPESQHNTDYLQKNQFSDQNWQQPTLNNVKSYYPMQEPKFNSWMGQSNDPWKKQKMQHDSQNPEDHSVNPFTRFTTGDDFRQV